MPSIDVAQTVKDLNSYTSSDKSNAETRFRRYVAEVEIQEADLATYREIAQEQARELVYLRTELEGYRSKAPLTLELSNWAIDTIGTIVENALDEKFSVKVEDPIETSVKISRLHYETPEAFQDWYIDRDYNDVSGEYWAQCTECDWETDGTHESVVDDAAYEHAEKHVNEEKESK